MMSDWYDRKGVCTCEKCGAIYRRQFSAEFASQYIELPLWLKADFKGEVFWALNGEHFNHLERVIAATLRERPLIRLGAVERRYKATRNMPFNLPSWLLSSKNRPDLLRLIRRLRKAIPTEMSEA